MTVFKTFFKILRKNLPIVLTYTIILLVFGIFNMSTSEKNINFVASKPDVYIVNNDKNGVITKNLIDYLSLNSNVVDAPISEEKVNDALFYRDANYVIYIPENYSSAFLEGKNPEIRVKGSGDYGATLAEMILTRYIKVANIYQKNITNENELISKINDTLENDVKVNITSKLDTNSLEKASYYYSFASYSILACLLLVISMILSSFNEEKIRKRIIISSTNYKKHNRVLLIANFCYSFVLWLLYVLLSFIIIGKAMFSPYGLLYMLNSFVFTICATTIALLIGNLVTSKGAINGIVNVIALGSSFLCGAFVPMEMLPESILKIAHVLPTYYFIKTNDLLKTLETINYETLNPIIINMLIIVCFSGVFIILSNIVSKKKRKIA